MPRPVALDVPIRFKYSTIDHFVEYKTYKSLEGAQAYARRRLGSMYDIGSFYAVSGDGVGKLEILSGRQTITELMWVGV